MLNDMLNLISAEQKNRIVQKEKFCEHYYPVSYRLLLDKLTSMGHTDLEMYMHPAQFGKFIERSDWYCVMAKKSK